MSSFTFKDISSEELGLIIKKPIIRPTWGNEYAEAALAGSLRKLMSKSAYYDNAELTIEAYVPGADQEKMRTIYSALTGEGRLVISTAPDEYIDAILRPLVPQPVALLSAELPITALCRPFAYSLNPTTLDLTDATSYQLVENAGTMYSEPDILFVPTSSEVTVDVNGKAFVVSGLAEQAAAEQTVVIDSGLEVVYYIDASVPSEIKKVDITYKSKYDFPLLHTGDNYVKHDGNVSSMSVNLKERWL